MKTKKNKGGAVWNVLSKGVNKDKSCDNEYKDYYDNWKDNPHYTSYDPLKTYPSKISRKMYNTNPQLRSGPKCSVDEYNAYKIQKDKIKSPTQILPGEPEILYTPTEEPISSNLSISNKEESSSEEEESSSDEEESDKKGKSIDEDKTVKPPSVITLSNRHNNYYTKLCGKMWSTFVWYYTR